MAERGVDRQLLRLDAEAMLRREDAIEVGALEHRVGVAERAADGVAVGGGVGVRRQVVGGVAVGEAAVDRRHELLDAVHAHVAVEVVAVLLAPAQDVLLAAEFVIGAGERGGVVHPAAALVRDHHVEEVHVLRALDERGVAGSSRYSPP